MPGRVVVAETSLTSCHSTSLARRRITGFKSLNQNGKPAQSSTAMSVSLTRRTSSSVVALKFPSSAKTRSSSGAYGYRSQKKVSHVSSNYGMHRQSKTSPRDLGGSATISHSIHQH